MVAVLFNHNSYGNKTNVNAGFNLSKYEKRNLWNQTEETLDDGRCNMYYSWFVVLAVLLAKAKDSHQWIKERNLKTAI